MTLYGFGTVVNRELEEHFADGIGHGDSGAIWVRLVARNLRLVKGICTPLIMAPCFQVQLAVTLRTYFLKCDDVRRTADRCDHVTGRTIRKWPIVKMYLRRISHLNAARMTRDDVVILLVLVRSGIQSFNMLRSSMVPFRTKA
jgi:hypothetical protein